MIRKYENLIVLETDDDLNMEGWRYLKIFENTSRGESRVCFVIVIKYQNIYVKNPFENRLADFLEGISTKLA